VVIAIIAILGAVTIFAVGRLARDARRASATNTVVSVLDNARAYAIRENRMVLVAFRSQFGDGDSEYVEAVLCRWTGETYFAPSAFFGGNALTDRFIPVPGVRPRALPKGFKVAAPRYVEVVPAESSLTEYDRDRLWVSQSQLSAIDQDAAFGGEPGGVIVVVQFNSRGERVMLNPESDSIAAFIDWDDNLLDTMNGGGMRRNGMNQALNNNGNLLPYDTGFNLQRRPDDEAFVYYAPFLAVYDDEDARSLYDTTQWVDIAIRRTQLSDYINERADRLHFNRYSGVVMK
ncbi:MAG: hypothetical protein KC983_06535, partial [Phycisphaerales bacterium]|nr:hypothetical protein [Phycisphaerales bacterium]